VPITPTPDDTVIFYISPITSLKIFDCSFQATALFASFRDGSLSSISCFTSPRSLPCHFSTLPPPPNSPTADTTNHANTTCNDLKYTSWNTIDVSRPVGVGSESSTEEKDITQEEASTLPSWERIKGRPVTQQVLGMWECEESPSAMSVLCWG